MDLVILNAVKENTTVILDKKVYGHKMDILIFIEPFNLLETDQRLH